MKTEEKRKNLALTKAIRQAGFVAKRKLFNFLQTAKRQENDRQEKNPARRIAKPLGVIKN